MTDTTKLHTLIAKSIARGDSYAATAETANAKGLTTVRGKEWAAQTMRRYIISRGLNTDAINGAPIPPPIRYVPETTSATTTGYDTRTASRDEFFSLLEEIRGCNLSHGTKCWAVAGLVEEYLNN